MSWEGLKGKCQRITADKTECTAIKKILFKQTWHASSWAWLAVSRRQASDTHSALCVLPDNWMMDKVWPLSLWTTWGRRDEGPFNSECAKGATKARRHTREHTLLPERFHVFPTTYCQIPGLRGPAHGAVKSPPSGKGATFALDADSGCSSDLL